MDATERKISTYYYSRFASIHFFLLSAFCSVSTVYSLPPSRLRSTSLSLSDSAIHFPDSGYYACEIRDNRFLVKIRRSERALLELWNNKAIQSREIYEVCRTLKSTVEYFTLPAEIDDTRVVYSVASRLEADRLGYALQT